MEVDVPIKRKNTKDVYLDPLKVTKNLDAMLHNEQRRNDAVIREVPVFLSKTLIDELYLVQYPQRPANVSTKNMNIVQTKIKPQQNKLQLSIEMDTESEVYDPESAELLAEAAAGLGLDEDKYMPDHRLKLDKTTMESQTVPKLADMSRYAIGVIRDGQLTLTPLKTVVQMKTVFPHLNKAEKAKTAFQKEQSGEVDEEEEEATKVTVKFSRSTAAQGDKPTGARVSSYSARKKDDEEPWVDLEYIYEQSAEFDKLYTTKQDTPFYVLPKNEYLELLFPKHLEQVIDGVRDDGEGKAKGKRNPKISIQQMKLMTIPDQLRVLLSNAKIMQYKQIAEFLKTRLKSEFDDSSLVKAIQTVGILVQGCWVVKSDIIYPDEIKSGSNGIVGSVMQRGRDFILSEFTESRFVERKKMMTITKLPAEEIAEILSHVSNMVPKKGWEFKLAFDSDFVTRFPEVAERQSLIWQMKKQSRVRFVSSMESSSSPPQRRKSRNSRSVSISSSGEESSDNEHGGRKKRQRSGGEESAGGRQRRTSSNRSTDIAGIPASRAET